MEFLTKPENLTLLIKYATQMPKNIQSKDHAYRFPFVASDILANSQKLAEAMIRVKEVDSNVAVEEEHTQKVEGAAEEKQTLVEDLDEIQLEEDEFEANMKDAFEDAGKEEKPSRNSFTDKTDEEQEQDEEVNVGEEEETTTPSQPKITIKVSNISSKPSKLLNTPSGDDIDNQDYSILDELFSPLDLPSENLEPILCGYFNKVV